MGAERSILGFEEGETLTVLAAAIVAFVDACLGVEDSPTTHDRVLVTVLLASTTVRGVGGGGMGS